MFVFVNRRRDRIKILYWGQTGFCIWYQQLQKGTYQLPDQDAFEQQETLEVTRSQLSLILDGIDLSSARQRKRFQLPRELLLGDGQGLSLGWRRGRESSLRLFLLYFGSP